MVGRFPNETSVLVMVFSILNEERLKWQKVRMKAEDIAWIEEASKGWSKSQSNWNSLRKYWLLKGID